MKIIRNPDGQAISVILPGEHSRETVLQSLTETESVWNATGGETIPLGHWIHEIVPLISFAPPAGHDEAVLVRHDSGLLYTIMRDERFTPYASGSVHACERWTAWYDQNPTEELLALRTADSIGWTPFHSDDELVGIIKPGTFSRADCEYVVEEVFCENFNDETGLVYADWTTVVQYLKTFTLPAQQRSIFSRDEDVTEYFTHPDGTLHTVFSSSPKVYSHHAVQAIKNWRNWTSTGITDGPLKHLPLPDTLRSLYPFEMLICIKEDKSTPTTQDDGIAHDLSWFAGVEFEQAKTLVKYIYPESVGGATIYRMPITREQSKHYAVMIAKVEKGSRGKKYPWVSIREAM